MRGRPPSCRAEAGGPPCRSRPHSPSRSRAVRRSPSSRPPSLGRTSILGKPDRVSSLLRIRFAQAAWRVRPRAPRSAGFGEQELLARSRPAHDRKAMAALEAGGGIELEGAEEGRRAESPGGAQWVVRAELEAAAGDERGRIG